MSLHPQPIGPVPDETIRVARAAFPRGNRWMRIRDELGTIFSDEDFATLFPRRGKPALPPWRLAVVILLQYAENLSDRQAADALRSRIDWKYLLGLTLDDAGFDASVLSEFRSRLVAGGAEERLLDRLLERCREKKWTAARGRQRTDSTHVLAAIRGLTRVECIAETMRHTLNALATVAPAWLRAHSRGEWLERYGPRAASFQAKRIPTAKAKRRAYAEAIGRDGHALLELFGAADAPEWLRTIPAVQTLRRVWIQNFHVTAAGRVRWRTAQTEGIPPSALFVASPYDTEAHYGKKRTTSWITCKVHVTETCDPDGPHLLTHVETTSAPVVDRDVLDPVHTTLKDKDLLPRVHLADAGYIEAEQLVRSRRDHGVDLLGPTTKNYHWQTRENTGFAARDFSLDWKHREATCPAGHKSATWTPGIKGGKAVIQVRFSMKHCGSCAHKPQCTRARRRTLTLRHHDEHVALERARERETTDAFQNVRAWKGRSPKPPAPCIYAAPATSGWPRPTCST